jgi:hypothetical protein
MGSYDNRISKAGILANVSFSLVTMILFLITTNNIDHDTAITYNVTNQVQYAQDQWVFDAATIVLTVAATCIGVMCSTCFIFVLLIQFISRWVTCMLLFRLWKKDPLVFKWELHENEDAFIIVQNVCIFSLQALSWVWVVFVVILIIRAICGSGSSYTSKKKIVFVSPNNSSLDERLVRIEPLTET